RTNERTDGLKNAHVPPLCSPRSPHDDGESPMREHKGPAWPSKRTEKARQRRERELIILYYVHTSALCSTGLLFSGCTNSHPPESDTSPLSFSILDESEMYA
ncbi:hypothetical protein ALC57_18208, partial [Trachymyrmex cornetzi]